MPRYFFHIDNGTFTADREGTELSSIEEARAEAVSLSGAMLQELNSSFWIHGGKLAVHVTDSGRHLLFSLHFTTDTPSGEVRYEPN